MHTLFQIDWTHLLVPTVALGEIILRGSLVYLLIFALMRMTLKREAGSIALPDLLMVVLVADAAQNAMATAYRSVTEGLVLVATIVGWNYALDWLATTCPFRKSCASMFWARQGVKSGAGSPHVALSLLYEGY
jgi:hypothetical protein